MSNYHRLCTTVLFPPAKTIFYQVIQRMAPPQGYHYYADEPPLIYRSQLTAEETEDLESNFALQLSEAEIPFDHIQVDFVGDSDANFAVFANPEIQNSLKQQPWCLDCVDITKQLHEQLASTVEKERLF